MTAITDHASLKAAVLDEIIRAGATDIARLPRFIQSAEQMIAHGTAQAPAVRIEDMEANADIAFTNGVGTRPANYLEQVRLYWDGNYNLKLTYRTPRDFWEHRYLNGAGSLPVIYTVEATTIHLSPTATGTGKLRYIAKLASLSGDSDTNWLLSNTPVYFHATCLQAFRHLRNMEKAAEHMGAYIDAVTALERSDEKKRTGGRSLYPRVPRSAI